VVDVFFRKQREKEGGVYMIVGGTGYENEWRAGQRPPGPPANLQKGQSRKKKGKTRKIR